MLLAQQISMKNFRNFLNDAAMLLAHSLKLSLSQPAFTCSKLTIETVEQGVKYVQS